MTTGRRTAGRRARRTEGGEAASANEVEPSPRSVRFQAGVAVGVALSVALGVFLVQNADRTVLEYLWFEFDTPLWVGMLVTFTVGCVVGATLSWTVGRRPRRESARGSR